MNNNRLAGCIGFFLFVISLLLSLTKSTMDTRGLLIIGLCLMAGGLLNEIMGEKGE